MGRTHTDHFSWEPDGVRRAYEVFEPRCIDARGHRFVRHLVAVVVWGQSAERETENGRVGYIGRVTVAQIFLRCYYRPPLKLQ
jgi:hypothetical protein